MGLGECRFYECKESSPRERSTSIDYKILLEDQNLELYICGLWEHYATYHNVLPQKRARDAVMQADPNRATMDIMGWRGEGPERVSMYFVERAVGGYNHDIGESPDKEFIGKLKQIINFAGEKGDSQEEFFDKIRQILEMEHKKRS